MMLVDSHCHLDFPDFADEVGDVKHLTTIIAALRATPVINSVERARG